MRRIEHSHFISQPAPAEIATKAHDVYVLKVKMPQAVREIRTMLRRPGGVTHAQ